MYVADAHTIYILDAQNLQVLFRVKDLKTDTQGICNLKLLKSGNLGVRYKEKHIQAEIYSPMGICVGQLDTLYNPPKFNDPFHLFHYIYNIEGLSKDRLLLGYRKHDNECSFTIGIFNEKYLCEETFLTLKPTSLMNFKLIPTNIIIATMPEGFAIYELYKCLFRVECLLLSDYFFHLVDDDFDIRHETYLNPFIKLIT